MWDARRRNRNLGTAKAGHGARNCFTIPERGADLAAYWQRLGRYVAVERSLGSHAIAFLVEPPRRSCLHHCTVEDLLRVLALLPFEHASLPWHGDEDRFWELYRARPNREREVAAHRYADELRRELQERQLIPFDSQYDAAAMRADRLDPAWFARL